MPQRTALSSNFAIFSFLLGLGTILHKTQMWEGLSHPLPLLTSVLAVVLMFRPGDVRLFVALAVATLAEGAWYAPFFFLNHMVFTVFLLLGGLGAMLAVRRREGRWPSTPGELESDAFPLFRWGVIVMFFFVVLHKTNPDFFDPIASCAVEKYEMLVGRLPFLPVLESAGSHRVMAWFTYVTESSIPVLLLFRRTRFVGILVACGFHYVMGFMGIWSFSAAALAFYVAFLPTDFHLTLRRVFERLPGGLVSQVARLGVPVTMAVFTAGITVSHAMGRTYQIERLGYLLYLVLAAFIFALLVAVVWLRRGSEEVGAVARMGRLRGWHVALLALLALSSFSPYLGLRTESSLSMFSNLRTERGHWNHPLVPEAVRVFAFQDTLVVVDEVTNFEVLRNWERHPLSHLASVDGAAAITMFELRRQVREHCDAGQRPLGLRYSIEGGASYDLVDACGDPLADAGNPWILEKLLWFRPVILGNSCQH